MECGSWSKLLREPATQNVCSPVSVKEGKVISLVEFAQAQGNRSAKQDMDWEEVPGSRKQGSPGIKWLKKGCSVDNEQGDR